MVLQYTYLSITNCLCSPAGGSGGGISCSGWIIRPTAQRAIAILGLQASARACLPMFVAYLATLMYNYQLSNIVALGRRASGMDSSDQRGAATQVEGLAGGPAQRAAVALFRGGVGGAASVWRGRERVAGGALVVRLLRAARCGAGDGWRAMSAAVGALGRAWW